MKKIMNILNNIQLVSALIIITASIVNKEPLVYLLFGIVLLADAVRTNMDTAPEDKVDLSLIYIILTVFAVGKILGVINLPWVLIVLPIWAPVIGVIILFVAYLFWTGIKILLKRVIRENE
jgi:hypothetical protein